MSELAVMEAETSTDVGLFRLPGFYFSDTGLVIEEWVSFDNWLNAGREICRASRAVNWWIGDWLAFGEHKFGEKYSQAETVTGIDEKTLQNYNFVSRNVENSRRREFLSWSHHREVAALPPAEQGRFLAIAEEEELSKLKLRNRIQAKKIEATDYQDCEPSIREDYARIKARFNDARRPMDEFVAEFTQFQEYWESMTGDVSWDLANPHESSEAWIERKVLSGCAKVRELTAETKLKRDIVESALHRLVAAGKVYKDKQGAATSDQRGAKEDIYLPAKASHQDIYEGRSSGAAMPDWDVD